MGTKLTPADFWTPPSEDGKYRTGLRVNNSMAGGKVEFIPHSKGRKITWYGCGPTVYDAAHMGHARTYIAFDIIRRIMTDYFGYEVFMCMNITDIDDKIIMRSIEKGVDFASLARYWEGRFWEDMKTLNVQLPDVVTRVSEYIPEVVDFIKRIVDNGYGYESEGSVYFDTEKFRSAEGHVYGRMEPYSVSDEARVLEGEGNLGIITEKKCALDFALWKKAKPGEPSWDSPWGQGRPGWHIECSAMASSIFGFPLDIHSGGVDLRFPHHDNELAQSEAAYNQGQWVHYFLHSGHLHIKGSKMSKSLKNFITIRESLEVFSPRSIRLLTLMHNWDSPMNYATDGDSIVEASEVDSSLVHFFGTVAAALRGFDVVQRNVEELASAKDLQSVDLVGLLAEQRWTAADAAFNQSIHVMLETVDSALRDNFNTPSAFQAMRSLVSETNVYLKKDGKPPLVLKAARALFKLLKIFGVTNGNENEMDYVNAGSGTGTETEMMDVITAFRHSIRTTSQELLKQLKVQFGGSQRSEGGGSQLLQLAEKLLATCDQVRDVDLVELGLRLEDLPSGSVWKKTTKEELVKEKERKRQEEERKQMQKMEAQKAQAEAKAKKEALLRIPPTDYFKETKADAYSAFDESGVPLANADGSPLSKSQRDKLAKALDKHRLAHEAWLTTNSA